MVGLPGPDLERLRGHRDRGRVRPACASGPGADDEGQASARYLTVWRL